MKKIVIILSLMLALSVAGGITVFAVYDSEEIQAAEPIAFSKYEKRGGVQLHRDISMKAGNETVSLDYKITELHYGGGYMDVYLDDAGNEYWYDENGKFYAFTSMDFSDLSYVDMPELPENKAVELARKYAVEFFGDAVSDLEFEKSSSYDDGLTYIEFNKKLGENGCFIGPICLVTLKNDGGLFSCSCKNVRDLENFDVDLLLDITSEDVSQYVESLVEKEYSGYHVMNCEISEMTVTKADGSYVISALTEIIYSDIDGSEVSVLQNYYYELEK